MTPIPDWLRGGPRFRQTNNHIKRPPRFNDCIRLIYADADPEDFKLHRNKWRYEPDKLHPANIKQKVKMPIKRGKTLTTWEGYVGGIRVHSSEYTIVGSLWGDHFTVDFKLGFDLVSI
jgi:hypothetical protein